jgi:ferredoxin
MHPRYRKAAQFVANDAGRIGLYETRSLGWFRRARPSFGRVPCCSGARHDANFHGKENFNVSTGLTTRSGSVRMCARNPHFGRLDVAYSAPSIEEFQAGTVVKYEPISTGTTTQRKRKPHILAVINECCTGCSGSPACVEYCPVADCMYWAPDEDHAPFGRIIVDPLLCIGCKLCTSKGPDGAFLEGCPWDAIDMVPLAEFEGANGALPF